jgi:hypothetical protein
LKSHRLRCEIERAFFFQVFQSLLKERFGDSVTCSAKESKFFERLGSEVSLETISQEL